MSQSLDSVQEFGRELINARKFKNISLEQIAEETKISIHYLKAMEDGEWDVLPRPYMEVFLRAYAEAAGMNVPKVMKKYREMVRRESDSGHEAKETAEPDETALASPLSDFFKRLFQAKIPLIAGAVILLALFLWFALRTGDHRSEIELPAAGSVQQDSSLQSAESRMARESRTSSVPVSGNLTQTTSPETKEFTLSARAKERCWLRATIDQERVKDVYLYPGDQITLKARRRIHLVVGNAGGLELSLAGQVLDSLGPSQKPVTIVIGSEGILSQRLGAWQVDFSGEMNTSPPDSTARP